MRSLARSTILMAFLACLFVGRSAPAQDPEIPPFDRAEKPGDPPPVPGTEGEVQGRGPIHEGFAQPGSGVGRPGAVVPKQPPAPVPETPPEQRPAGDNVAWIPGYWSWDTERRDFLWVSGFWRVVPAGRTWVAGYWAKTDDGWRWVSGSWSLSAQASPYVPAPPESLDRGPTQPPPEEGYSYVPGTWLYDETRWLWRPGYYVAPRAGLLYTPSRYLWTPRGYRFVPGFWDRPLESRGVLFAPVYFGADFSPAQGWAYRPRYTVDINGAIGSLWVTPGATGYAFGNFYTRPGYQSWLVHGPATRDPLYAYYRYANRGDPTWRGSLVATYNGRVRGTLTVPPSTLAGQGRTRDASLRTVTPLSGYRNPSLRMADVAAVERGNAARRAAELRSSPQTTSPQRSPYAGYPLSPPRESARTTAPPTVREVPRTTTRSIELPRPYTPSVQRYTPAPIARPHPVAIAAPPHIPPVHHYAPPAAQHATPPARSAPPAHSGGRPGPRR